MAAETKNPPHKSRTHRLPGPHKQAGGVERAGNGQRKLEAIGPLWRLLGAVGGRPAINLGLVMRKSSHFPYITDVDKSATKGAKVGSPVDVLREIVRALRSMIGETRMFEHRNCANLHVLCPEIIVDSRTVVRISEKQLAVLTWRKQACRHAKYL